MDALVAPLGMVSDRPSNAQDNYSVGYDEPKDYFVEKDGVGIGPACIDAEKNCHVATGSAVGLARKTGAERCPRELSRSCSRVSFTWPRSSGKVSAPGATFRSPAEV